MDQFHNDPPSLPKGWSRSRLGELVADGLIGLVIPMAQQSKNAEGVPYVKMNNITSDGHLDLKDMAHVSINDEELKRYQLRKGDILFNTRNSYELVGKTAIVGDDQTLGVFNNNIMRIRIVDYVNPSFISYQMNSPSFREYITREKKATTNICALYARDLMSSPIMLSPVSEQLRIVVKLEELFSKLDAGVKSLETVKAQLKLYRQSVLKSAFEGKLTEEWRRTHRDELEPASKLLERIKEERRKSTVGKYRELPPLDTSNLPELPEGWVWTKLEDITVEVENVNPKEQMPEDEFTYLDIASIDNRKQEVTSPKKYLGKDAPSRARQLVKANDILFSTVRTYLRNIAMVDRRYDGQIASTGFCVIRPFEYINKKLVFYLAQTDSFLNPLTEIQRGTSYPAVRNSDVYAQTIPLPPLLEQHRIVEEIERCFSVADDTEKIAVNSLKQSEKLRQSILKRAFEGKLVPQDPSDEPASVLLERIKSLKAQVEQDKKTRKGRKRYGPKQRRLT